MTTTMNNAGAVRRAQRQNLVKAWIACLLAVCSVGSFFFPYVQYQFGDSVYRLSGLQLLTASGLRVHYTTLEGQGASALLSLPLLAKICVTAGAALSLLGVLFLLLKKQTLSGGCFALSAICPLIVLLTSSSIQTAVTALNISEVKIAYLWPFILALLGGLASAVLAVWIKGGEKLAESIFLVFACVSVGSVAVITIYMIVSGLPAISEIGLGNFLFGTEWKPKSGVFGILPLILSSIAGTFGAILIGVPVGILTAVFLSEVARPGVARVVRPAVQLLAGIPSVIYGFFGMLVVVPAIRAVFPQSIGDSLLAVILILAIMVLPTIVSVAETSLKAVPFSYREASLALGATPTTTIFRVTVPAAKSGILAGVILGVGRAIGETMAVIMVAGNVANMPELFGTVRLLTTGVVMEMSYSSGLHRQALFAIGLVLFVFIMIVNISFTLISKKGAKVDAQ